MSLLPRNLAALQQISPKLAQQLHQTPIPPDFLPTLGTDNTPTFSRISTTDNKKSRHWLGHTSLPAASAHALIASLDLLSSGANGLALTVGTGFQWRAATDRLGRAQMLYVYEPDPALLRIALEICDLSDLLATRRIVLLAGDASDAAQDLATFLAQNPGFEPPTVLHPPANLLGERRTALVAAGEAIVRHAVQERAAAEAEAQQRLGAALANAHGPNGSSTFGSRDCQATVVSENHPRPEGPAHHAEQPALALLLTPRHAHERPIYSAAPSAKQIFIDHYASASQLLRLTTLAEMLERANAAGTGGFRILSDLFGPQLVLPPQIPVETWVPPLVGTAYWERIPNALGPNDRVIVHFTHHQQMLRDRGIAAPQIVRRPLSLPGGPPTTTTQHSALSTQHSQLTLRHRVALIADLPASDAATLAIILPTHQAVYAAARELIEADYLAARPGMAADFLRRALTRAGVDPKIDDPSLKDPMLRVIAGVLIPAVPLLTLAHTLLREGVALTLIGDWPGLDIPNGAQARHVPFAAYTPADWDDVALLAHHAPDGVFSPLLLEAAACGIPIAAAEHPMEADLAKLLAPETAYARAPARGYIAAIKSLLRDGARREKIAAAALRQVATY